MNLVNLLLELKPLLEAPEPPLPRLIELLEAHKGLAEYEVARFLVGRTVGAEHIARKLRSEDPRERLQGARLVPLLLTSEQASGLLRRAVKDADTRVAQVARAQVWRLGLRDVAPPDSRAKRSRSSYVRKASWDPSGWCFGLFPSYWYTHHVVRKAPPSDGKLPKLRTRADVAKLVGLEASELEALMRPGTGAGSGYVEFEVPKRTGGTRRISAPRAKLKAVQRVLLEKVLAHMPAHPAVHGFVEGRSTVSNAAPHVGARVVVRVDLEDFFPTVHYRRVQGLFMAHGYGMEVASVLAGLTTHRTKLADGTVVWPGVLPQGAPTSPAIANLVCRRLDARLSALAKKVGATYTRYADDMSFSFPEPPERLGRFLWWVNAICQQEGFLEKTSKRRIMRSGSRQRVTGLSVNQQVSIPREDRRRFKAILANCRKHGVASQARGRPDFARWLEGYAAYVGMVHPELGERWQREVKSLLGR